MNIYVDFDDCLCETARYFSDLVGELYGVDVLYERIKCFNLQKSFSLSEVQYEKMMEIAHTSEALLSYKETPGAVKTVNGWIDEGHDVKIITGRPSSAFEASRKWLNVHGLERVKLFCLNKYRRNSFLKGSDFTLELEDYYKMHFDFAVEDSPAAFKFFEHLPGLKVMIFDRPWNRDCVLPGDNFKRCFDWDIIKDCVF